MIVFPFTLTNGTQIIVFAHNIAYMYKDRETDLLTIVTVNTEELQTTTPFNEFQVQTQRQQSSIVVPH